MLSCMHSTIIVMRENTYNIIRQELCFSLIHSRNAATVLGQSVSSSGPDVRKISSSGAYIYFMFN